MGLGHGSIEMLRYAQHDMTFLGFTVFNGKTIFTTKDTKVTKEKRL